MNIEVDGKALQVNILDTAGQDEFISLREGFIGTGDGFLLVYSVTDDQTLEELRHIHEQIVRAHGRKVPTVIVGNKVDMEADRAVSREEGQMLATEFNALFIEVSAKNNIKVREAFELLIRKILIYKPSAGQQKGSGSVYGAGIIDNSGDMNQSRIRKGNMRDSLNKGSDTKSKGSNGCCQIS